MDLFNGYKIHKEVDGYTLVLYISPSQAEFSKEICSKNPESCDKLNHDVEEYVKTRFSKLKINAVKVMLGSMLVASFGFGTAPAKAAEISSTTYIVVSGDSLSAIAKRFNTTVDQIKSLNGLTSDLIYPSQVLKIPSPTVAPTVTTTTYKVVSGDSLWGIAAKFNTTVDNLKALNNLTTTVIYTGQILKVPAAAPATISSSPTVTYKNHTVASGENSWIISIKYGIPMSELLRANNFTESTVLSIGQVIRIPVHTVPVTSVPGPQYGEYLDWWTQAQYLLTINKTARVIDFQTGRAFYVKRTIGANHSDTEPLTSQDAAIIKEIWGGAYSWKTRAVIVEVDGRRIAASMTSMPHGVEYIGPNSFDGHFDIHFKNSTRHSDGAIDSYHQTQIKIAAGVI